MKKSASRCIAEVGGAWGVMKRRVTRSPVNQWVVFGCPYLDLEMCANWRDFDRNSFNSHITSFGPLKTWGRACRST